MTLEEAIKYHEEVAEEQEEKIKSCMFRSYCDGTKDCQMSREWKNKGCLKCAAEHRQLAEWLKELKQLREQTRWIPVSERLPEETKAEYWVCTDNGCQCQCRWTNNPFGLGEGDIWAWSIFDIPQYSKVKAWKPLPEPYKAEREPQESEV